MHGAYKFVASRIWVRCKDRVQRISRESLSDERLHQFSEAVREKGLAIDVAWGFIDGYVAVTPVAGEP